MVDTHFPKSWENYNIAPYINWNIIKHNRKKAKREAEGEQIITIYR